MANFTWSDFLKTTNSAAIPEELFSHVELSLCNGIKQDMLLEVCYDSNPDVYWIAQITMACGHFLRIKFVGGDEETWINLATTKVKPLGWCGKYEEYIEPPDDINDAQGDYIIDVMRTALGEGLSVTAESLLNKGLSPIDRLKQGMKVEVQNTVDPYKYWIATISENKGGRLLLKYDGSDDDLPQFWIFYTNHRLCSFGYVTNKGSPWQFKYPGKVNKFSCKNKLSSQLRQCAEENIQDPTPSDLFQVNVDMECHNFVTGMKLEALDPQTMQTIRPATVTKVFNNFHFLVVIDDHLEDYEETKMCVVCDSKNPYIYPIGWAEKHSVPFTIPKIWKEDIFDWDEYLSITSSVPAPEYCFGKKKQLNIKVNMKLEAVNPKNQEEIHVANVCCVTGHMMCVELIPIGEKFWFAQDCDLVFPVGWCDSNNYEMTVPQFIIEPVEVKETKKPPEEWCDRIYFNYKCYSGPMISRNKLSQLPKHVGPGPLSLVLKEVLNKMISASYKPAKLLKDWEVEEGPAEEGMRLEVLKAKLKTSTYHAYVPIATSADQVAAFCREYCVKLQACPNLFGPKEYTEQCPETCLLVEKSKFQNSTDRRRAKASMNGRRKKRKGPAPGKPKPAQEMETNKDVIESPESEHSTGSTPPSESGTRPSSPDSNNDKRKKKQESKNISSKMRTRGAKLPNFAMQIKEAHWNKKDVDTMYNNTGAKRQGFPESDTENDSRSTNSRDLKHISDVSDSEEPELKKLKFTTNDPLPTDNKSFEKNAIMSYVKSKLNLSPNPIRWSIDDVYKYLSNTEDCKLIADRMRQEQIDGQAFIMLDLPVLREFLHMKNEFALQLCRHITIIKWYYFMNYGAEA